MEEGFLYCGKCGHQLGSVEPTSRLRRCEERKIAGVCGGVAKYFHVDETLVRALWAGSAVLPFTPGLFAYMACWAVIPRESEDLAANAAKPGRLRRLADLVPFRRPVPSSAARHQP